MKKIVKNGKISFTVKGCEKLAMLFLADEFVWVFNDSERITVTKDMELYPFLEFIMGQNYTFSKNDGLKDEKDENKLVWYSDCSFNPDSELSRNSVSYLTIEKGRDQYTIFATKPLDEIYYRPNKFHLIAFSPAGNGKYAINNETGTTLQDDFIQMGYFQLLESKKEKEYKFRKNTGKFN